MARNRNLGNRSISSSRICGAPNQPSCPLGSSRDGSVTVRVGEVDEINKTLSIVISSDSPISGFQFTVDSSNSTIDWVNYEGILDWGDMVDYQLQGGLAYEYGFMTSMGGNDIVLGFNMSAGEIPPGNGILTTIGYSGTGTSTVCITDALFITGYDDASWMNVTYGECIELNFRGNAPPQPRGGTTGGVRQKQTTGAPRGNAWVWDYTTNIPGANNSAADLCTMRGGTCSTACGNFNPSAHGLPAASQDALDAGFTGQPPFADNNPDYPGAWHPNDNTADWPGGVFDDCSQHFFNDGFILAACCNFGGGHVKPGIEQFPKGPPIKRKGGRAMGTKPSPIGRGRKMAHGGTSHCGHPGQPPCPSDYNSGMGSGYRRGGAMGTKRLSRKRKGNLATRPRKFNTGGRAGHGSKCGAGYTLAADGSCIQG